MTCIVGVPNPGKGAILGSDSCGGSNDWSSTVLTPKLYQLSPHVAVGFTTSWRLGQILGHHLQLVEQGCPPKPFEWVVTKFVVAAREAMQAHGYMKKDQDREEGGTFLVAVADKVFGIGDDFAVVEHGFPDSCGSGWHFAIGAMRGAAMGNNNLTSRQIAEIGMRAASDVSTHVRPPFHLIETVVGTPSAA